MKHFQVNDNLFYVENPYVKENTFLTQETVNVPLPAYSDVKDRLPLPVWDGHDDAIACYHKAWEIAFGNLRRANAEAGFVSDFIDTAFNGYLFMWDSSFITMFGKYGSHIFDFQKTLDNFYSHQHRDGFICREICETQRGEQFTRDDPASTGPNILPWAEWEYYQSTGDIERLRRVFPALCAFHKWMQLNRSWPSGGYYSCGFACGMDNQPRLPEGYDVCVSHGFMTWIDTCAQQLLSADILIRISEILGRGEETEWLRQERVLLSNLINNHMWDEQTAYYFDTFRDGTLSDVKTVGSYWTLLAGIVPEERADRFVAHLNDPREFNRPVRVPTLSADHPKYAEYGCYWCGSVWAPTNYMVLKGLERYGYHALAHDIACSYMDCVAEVFSKENTLFENYAPEHISQGSTAKRDFVGWTGLAPISILFEYVFGIHPDAQNRRITWHVNRTERHGVLRYPLGDTFVDLICEARTSADEHPMITVKTDSDIPVTVEVIRDGHTEIISA